MKSFFRVSVRALLQVVFAGAAASIVSAQTPPANFEDRLVAGGLSSPTAMDFSPDGRIFVCQQTGALRIIKNGVLLPTPFLSLNVTSSGERGLLGVAFDPNFATNRYLYVYYTAASNGQNRVSRFTASSTNPDIAQAGSELVLFDVAAATVGYHNGGALHFGNDGKLYIGVGDGHDSSNAQALGSVQGKILRIDPAAYPNLIPSDNPFVGTAGARGEVWAYGLRNPFTFSVDPETGRIFINDVGAGTWEEIDEGTRGGNYGWPTCEGACGNSNFINPFHAYNHSQGCAITGGTFYRGTGFPSQYAGDYFFADFCDSNIRRLRPDKTVSNFVTGVSAIVDFKVFDGSLYYLSRGSNSVRRVTYTGSAPAAPGNFRELN